MSGVEDLLALADRVEALAGPDRIIDRDIAIATMGWPAAAFTDAPTPEYTASIDAALTLVPDGHTVQLSDWDHEILRAKGPWQAIVLPMGARGAMQDYTFTNRCDHAATPALALCAAALRARSLVSLPSDMEIDSNG